MRTNCSGLATFWQLLERVHEVALRAYEHQALPALLLRVARIATDYVALLGEVAANPEIELDELMYSLHGQPAAEPRDQRK